MIRKRHFAAQNEEVITTIVGVAGRGKDTGHRIFCFSRHSSIDSSEINEIKSFDEVWLVTLRDSPPLPSSPLPGTSGPSPTDPPRPSMDHKLEIRILY